MSVCKYGTPLPFIHKFKETVGGNRYRMILAQYVGLQMREKYFDASCFNNSAAHVKLLVLACHSDNKVWLSSSDQITTHFAVANKDAQLIVRSPCTRITKVKEVSIKQILNRYWIC